MIDAQIIWKRIVNLEKLPAGIEDQEAISSFLSKVFYYTEGRNTYWGSWSSRYYGDSSFSLDQSALKSRIESQRKQGSQFTLTELPALALAANSYDLLLVQAWGDSPFEKVPRGAITGKRIFEVARSICTHDIRIYAFIAPRGQSKMPSLPFKRFRSFPLGFGYSLEWHRLHYRCDISSIVELVADVTLHLNSQG